MASKEKRGPGSQCLVHGALLLDAHAAVQSCYLLPMTSSSSKLTHHGAMKQAQQSEASMYVGLVLNSM